MTVAELERILKPLVATAEIQILLSDSGGLPDYNSACDVRCVQVDYTGEGQVESVSICMV